MWGVILNVSEESLFGQTVMLEILRCTQDDVLLFL